MHNVICQLYLNKAGEEKSKKYHGTNLKTTKKPQYKNKNIVKEKILYTHIIDFTYTHTHIYTHNLDSICLF